MILCRDLLQVECFVYLLPGNEDVDERQPSVRKPAE